MEEKAKNKIILIENGSPREVSQSEIDAIKAETVDSKNGISLMYMREDSEKQGCAVYRKVKKLVE